MLTKMDDMLWHQLATTFDHVGTSDPRFFDRHWLAAYAPDGDGGLQATMGVYRNMNVIDGGVVWIKNGFQHNFRVSRSIDDLNEEVCGPLRFTIVEPLQSLKMSLIDSSRGMSGELVWQAIAPAEEEAPHFKRERGRVVEDYQRFNQIGQANGWIEADGNRTELNNWWACRDHSWGVRPRIGVREPRTGARETLAMKGFTMAFLFFSTEQLTGTLLYMKREGETAYTSGLVRNRISGAAREVGRVQLSPQLYDGTRRFRTVAMEVGLEEGERLELVCASAGPAVAMRGLGYSGGYNDRKGLGAWRGEMLEERDKWDVSDSSRIIYPDGAVEDHWHRIQPVSITATFKGKTSKGQGSMTLILTGSIPELGLI